MKDAYLHPAMELSGRRILFVLPPARFDEAAFYQAWTLMSEEGAWLCVTADSPTGFAAGEEGSRERVADPTQLTARAFDAIVFVGGKADPLQGRAIRALVEQAIAGRVPLCAIGRLDLEAATIVADPRHLPRFVAEIAVRLRRSVRPRLEERPGL